MKNTTLSKIILFAGQECIILSLVLFTFFVILLVYWVTNSELTAAQVAVAIVRWLFLAAAPGVIGALLIIYTAYLRIKQ